MILLNVEEIVKHYGPEPVLDGVSFELRPGERVGLVGPNGTGKTTLLKILAGHQDADAGHVELHSSARLGYLEQQPEFASGRTLWDEAHSALDELIALQREAETVAASLAETQEPQAHKRLAERFDRVQHELQHRNAYQLDHRVERVLHGLGFSSGTFEQRVEVLSGGQQNRLLLARLLLADPDVMLLDEPSNHLDIEATEWLEDFLTESTRALIVVSHDRYFLDKVTNRTLELFHGTVDSYSGNFSAYWRQKAERLLVQQRSFERQQEMIAKTEDFIRRNHYGQKHQQAEDRRKKLARIERVAAPREIVAPPMGFPPADRTGDIVLRVERVAKGYDRTLFADLSFDILRGERWGILGPNGTGKTTLLRCIVGEERPDQGRVTIGSGVRIGYGDQMLRGLDEQMMVLDAIRPRGKEFNEQQRRDMLARFGLIGNLVIQSVGSLSGGERSRAALARLAAGDANFLVLDEPTNHLDLWARDALEEALNRFDGTVLFVSHDRYFLNRVADHVLVVEPHRFRVIEGNYDTYLHLVREGLAGKPSQPAKPVEKKSKPAATERRKRKFPYRKLDELEAEIFEREARIEELQASMSEPEIYRDGRRAREVQNEITEQQQSLATLYEHWEEASELN